MVAVTAVTALAAEGTCPRLDSSTSAPVIALFFTFGEVIASFFTFGEVIALFFTFRVVTAFFLSCFVPTLFLGRVSAA